MSSFPRSKIVLVSLVCAVATAVFFHFTMDTWRKSFFFEITMTATKVGVVQLFYDVGNGISEKDSLVHPLSASSGPHEYRFALAEGTYRNFRFDPVNDNTVVAFSDAKIIDRSGHVIRAFAARDFHPANDIASLIPLQSGLLEMHPTGGDPFLNLAMSEPLSLKVTKLRQVLTSFEVFLIVFVGGLLVSLVPTGSRDYHFFQQTPFNPQIAHLPLIDEIKGLGIVLVIWYHNSGGFGISNRMHGEIGVDIFLLLTGFVLVWRSAHLSVGDFSGAVFFASTLRIGWP